MKKAARRLLVMLCLILVAALIFLWIATDHRTWLINWGGNGRFHTIRADAWRLCYEEVRVNASATAIQGSWELVFPDGVRDGIGVIPDNLDWRNYFGFQNVSAAFVMNGYPVIWIRTTVPFWFLVLIFLVFPVVNLKIALGDRRRRSRLAAGLCVQCGYDLRATPDRCPECGKPVQIAQ